MWVPLNVLRVILKRKKLVYFLERLNLIVYSVQQLYKKIQLTLYHLPIHHTCMYTGTGKTSCLCYRLHGLWRQYWRTAIHAGPTMPMLVQDDASASTSASTSASASDSTNDQPGATSSTSTTTTGTTSGSAASMDGGGVPLGHLRQVFLTKSPVLRTEVQRVCRDLARGNSYGQTISDSNGVDGIETLRNVPESRYPLFATVSEMLRLLDRSLVGEPFLRETDNEKERDDEEGGLYAMGDYFEVNYDSDSDEEGKLDAGGFEDESARSEMTWTRFNGLWKKINVAPAADIDASVFWTEVNSQLKGSVDAIELLSNPSLGKNEMMAQLRDVYMSSGRKTSAILPAQREVLWRLFLKYEEFKRRSFYYDNNDLVAACLRRVKQHGTCGIFVHQLYVDEVQDFSMAELSLLVRFCDPNSAFLAGDSAQTIARGIGFRFVDLRSLFHYVPGAAAVPKPYTLTTNYRSHCGVLGLASSVVDIIYSFFPRAIDKLEPDCGLFDGPVPKLLMVESIPDLVLMLLGHQRSATGRIDFGPCES